MAYNDWGNPVAIITVSIQGEGFIMQYRHTLTEYETFDLGLTPDEIVPYIIEYLGWNPEFVLVTVDPVEEI